MKASMKLRGEAEPGRTEGSELAGGLLDLDSEGGGTTDRERERLAFAIHDGLTQVVTASVLELEALAHRVEIDPEEASSVVHEAVSELRKALDEIRDVLTDLTPSLSPGAQPIEDLLRSVLDRWHLPATWSVEGDLGDVPANVLEAASSVIRESVANAAKHANSRDVAIRVLASDRSVEVSVQDHGLGFTSSTAQAGHLGLAMLRRRVADVNGTLEVRSEPGKGTRVVARLPMSATVAEPGGEHHGEGVSS